MTAVLTIGSLAFDTIHNAQGVHEKVLGGSAAYASLAASFFCKNVQLVGVVGKDYPDSAIEMFRKHHVDISGLEVADGETFHWEGKYTDDLTSRESLRTDLNVFAEFDPKIPAKQREVPFVMLGNIHPSLQSHVLDQLSGKPFVIADTMNFWIDSALDDLRALMGRIDLLVVNEEEARQLSGKHHLIEAAEALHALGPKQLIIKQGEYGAFVFVENEPVFAVPAIPLAAKDPTGAGDTFAGAFLGSLAAQGDINIAAIKRAAVDGTVVASFCVQDVGPTRLLSLSDAEIDARREQLRSLTTFV